MKAWASDLEQLNFTKVRTYIQSGNAVFESPMRSASALAATIAQALDRRRKLAVPVLVLRGIQLGEVIAANPFSIAGSEPRSLLVYLLLERPEQPNLAALEALRAPSESYHLTRNALYLYAPDGIGRSRLAAGIDRHLGTLTTARNWNTMCKLLEMVRESGKK